LRTLNTLEGNASPARFGVRSCGFTPGPVQQKDRTMKTPTRRNILTALAAAPITAIAGSSSPDRDAIEAFRRADEHHRAAIEKVRMLAAELKAPEAEQEAANRAYDLAVQTVFRVMRKQPAVTPKFATPMWELRS
jgi:ferric-dicitrate binding protein FerR (iron transport regulator)